MPSSKQCMFIVIEFELSLSHALHIEAIICYILLNCCNLIWKINKQSKSTIQSNDFFNLLPFYLSSGWIFCFWVAFAYDAIIIVWCLFFFFEVTIIYLARLIEDIQHCWWRFLRAAWNPCVWITMRWEKNDDANRMKRKGKKRDVIRERDIII